MATQTEAQVQSEIASAIAIFQELSKAAKTNSSGTLSNYIAREETLLDVPEGDYSPPSRQALRASVRANLNAAIVSSTVRSVLDPLFQNYASLSSEIAPTSPDAIPAWLYRKFIEDTLRVQSRGITFASPAAASNLGSGVIRRLTKDAYGFDIEAVHIEAKRAYCIRDSVQGGAPIHEEVFRFLGQKVNIDQLSIVGSGAQVDIPAVSARGSKLRNPSFDTLDGSSITALTSIPDWTVGAEGISNYNLDRTNYYRGFSGAVDPASLKFLGNGSVEQTFDVPAAVFDGSRPAYLQVAFNRSIGSCNGLLWIQVGNASTSVVLSSQSGWTILFIPLTAALWPQNFAAVAGGNESVKVKIQLVGRTTGTLLVDDVILAEMVPFDGTYHLPIGGATPFVAGPEGARDGFTWTDTLAGADAILQQWFWRYRGIYLPHASGGSVTWAEPSV